MKTWQIALGVIIIALLGCGGGGAPATKVLLTGRVLSVVTGGPVNPPANVQVGTVVTQTNPADGSFAFEVPQGSSSLLVDTQSTFGTFTFTFPAATTATDVGDLWVGPEKVTVTGVVRNSTNNEPIPDATVSFAGRTAATNSSGVFTLTNVAYSGQNPEGFFGIVGQARATGFFVSNFSATQPASSGVVTVEDILLTPSTDTNPPPGPYNIWGRISPSALAPGTVVTLLDNGNPIRSYSVGSDGRYFFWVPAGTYTIKYQNGVHTAPDQTVTLTQQNQVVQRDVTLN